MRPGRENVSDQLSGGRTTMYSEIVTALSGLKTMGDLTKLVLKAMVDSAVTEKAIISLQSAMLDLQSQYQLVSMDKEELTADRVRRMGDGKAKLHSHSKSVPASLSILEWK